MYQVKRTYRQWLQSLLPLVLGVLFVTYYGGTSMFYHSHSVDGVTVTHSHPFQKGATDDASNTTHHHTKDALQLIQLLNQTTWEASSTPLLVPAPAYLEICTQQPVTVECFKTHHLRYLSLRAPPAC